MSYVLIGGLIVAATLESVFAVCLGCIVFNRLMRWGVIPADVCEECNDISRLLRPGQFVNFGANAPTLRCSIAPIHTPVP